MRIRSQVLAPFGNEGLTYDYHTSATIISIIPITMYRELKILKAFLTFVLFSDSCDIFGFFSNKKIEETISS